MRNNLSFVLTWLPTV